MSAGGAIRMCGRCYDYAISRPARVTPGRYGQFAEDWFYEVNYKSNRWVNRDWNCSRCSMWWKVHYKSLVLVLMKLGVRI